MLGAFEAIVKTASVTGFATKLYAVLCLAENAIGPGSYRPVGTEMGLALGARLGTGAGINREGTAQSCLLLFQHDCSQRVALPVVVVVVASRTM